MKKVLFCIIACTLIVTGLIPQAKAMTPIKIFANKFVYDDGTNTRINVKGIAYQPADNVDPIANDQLGMVQQMYNNFWKYVQINAIRVYQVDPKKDHSLVMSFLAGKGIYVMVGMVTGGPNATCIYARSGNKNFNLTTACFRVVDVAKEFNKYPNVLCYSVSNEVLAQPFSSDPTGGGSDPRAASYVKAVIRYLKSYQQLSGTRYIPVGLVLRDDPSFTMDAMSYYVSGLYSVRADFIGYNCYRWAGGTDQGRIDAYSLLYTFLEPIAKYVPIMLTEYGSMKCADQKGVRLWSQVPYLFGNKMVKNKNMGDVLAGGFAFRFFEKTEGFGLFYKTTLQPTPKGGWDNLITQYPAVFNRDGIAKSVKIPKDIPINRPSNPFDKPIPTSEK
ncbi:MAG: hypothetical protein GY750_09465 [Lentisphaerae bacterium]|nr:hypothetical protein [Lentisphaerota bacterium]MCP4101640.1 hypothetical protein [Lentisphaerota bacterium]